MTFEVVYCMTSIVIAYKNRKTESHVNLYLIETIMENEVDCECVSGMIMLCCYTYKGLKWIL